jgi:competence protein ComEC
VQQSLEQRGFGGAPAAWSARWRWIRHVLRERACALALLLEQERSRWVLWAPALLGAGVAAYFALPNEPAAWAGWVAAGLALALLATARRRPLAPVAVGEAILLALAVSCAGFALAQARLHAVTAPVLERAGTFRAQGVILDLAPFPEGAKVVLGAVSLERLPPERTPLTVRINLRDAGDLAPGDRIGVLARLQPPLPPSLPGAFDFARQAYFEQLGATGFALGRAERLSTAPDDRLALLLARLRATVAARILEVSPDAAGAMAAALIAGVRAGIDQATWHAMQVSGLAHLISVSGLHMVLVAGSVFTACRWLLALVPPLALRFPVKRIAAFVALLAAAFYLGLSGASVPTQRSFLMTGVGLVAVMVDRNPFSMRLLAWSALAVLVVSPESVLGASFQLSFAAVLALIAVFEAWRDPETRDEAPPPPRARGSAPWRYLLGVCATTLIASAATTPFAAFHFQTVPTYGVLANLIAVPLTSFVVMPAGLVGLLLLPLGWDGPAFALMALGVEGVLLTARTVAALPGALVRVTQWPFSALALLALAGLWLALWQRPWRWWAAVPAAVAVLLVGLSRPPDLVVDAGLGMAALRHAGDGSVTVIEWRRDRLVRENWLRQLGVAEASPAPRSGLGLQRGIACDLDGCTFDVAGKRVALARHAEAGREDCARAALVVARVGPERCPGPAEIIGPRALLHSGGLALRRVGVGLRVETVAQARGSWPWSRRFIAH